MRLVKTYAELFLERSDRGECVAEEKKFAQGMIKAILKVKKKKDYVEVRKGISMREDETKRTLIQVTVFQKLMVKKKELG